MLTPAAISLFSIIRELSRMSTSGNGWIPIKRLCKLTGFCAKTVKEAREELIRVGLIEKTETAWGAKIVIKCFLTTYADSILREVIAKKIQEMIEEEKVEESKRLGRTQSYTLELNNIEEE